MIDISILDLKYIIIWNEIFNFIFVYFISYIKFEKNVRGKIDLSTIRDKAQFYIYVSLHNEIQEDAK